MRNPATHNKPCRKLNAFILFPNFLINLMNYPVRIILKSFLNLQYFPGNLSERSIFENNSAVRRLLIKHKFNWFILLPAYRYDNDCIDGSCIYFPHCWSHINHHGITFALEDHPIIMRGQTRAARVCWIS